MPLYRTSSTEPLDELVAKVERNGERVVQIVPRQGRDVFIVLTQRPINDTGRAWSPSGMKETR